MDCWDVGDSYCLRCLSPAVGVCGGLMSAPPAARRLVSVACCLLSARRPTALGASRAVACWYLAVADFGRWCGRETCDVLRGWERRNR